LSASALNISNDVLTYGKLRVSYASVGGDTNPYQTLFNYTPQTGAFGQFGTGTTYPFNGTLAFGGPNVIPPADLRPEISNSFEAGTELQFFNGRLGLDVTYYEVITKDQILAIPIPESTGFTSKRTNIGQTSNTGWEIELDADIIRTSNFSWNTGINFTKNTFIVDELADGVDRLVVNSGFNSIQVVAEPGQTYGLYGNTFQRVEADTALAYLDRRILVDPNTGLRLTGDNERLGDVFPKFLMGMTNNLSWKGINLRFTVDWRNGGLIYSETVQNLRSLGLAAETGINRNSAYIDPEAVVVNADGTIRANDIPVTMQGFWGSYASGNIAEGNTFDASFVKLREIGISYSLPQSILGKTFIKGLSIGVEGRNLAILYKAVPHIDPETNLFGSANDGAGIEFNSPVTARTIGGNIKLTF
ncbi:MAG: TonB-dependent receptor, partial [Bacteroidota bacterium]